MALSDYTSPNSVRAVLGISAKEISDVVITDDVYLTNMLESLRAISTTLAADYLVAKALPTPTAAQARFSLLAGTFCAYAVAAQLVSTLPLAAPQLITDGKSQQGRIANPYSALLPSLLASLTYVQGNLVDAYSDVNPAIVKPDKKSRTMVTSVGLAVDPVTG